MYTLKKLKKLQKTSDAVYMKTGMRPHRISIRREVRYFAIVDNIMHELIHDWDVENLEKKIWYKNKKAPSKR